MKILITESQFKNILDDYFNKIIKSPEFNFVDHIEVIEGTTKIAKWKDFHVAPYYDYIVYVNDTPLVSSALSELYDKISDTHAILFPTKEDGTPRAYYSIHHRYMYI